MTRHEASASAILLAAWLGGCTFQAAGPTRPENAGAGVYVGDVARDFRLADQNGIPRSLSDYRGQVILLDLSTMWCNYCQKEAETAEEMYQQYRPRGFVIVNALWADYNGSPITVASCKSWADFYGLTFPVMADVDETAWRAYSDVPDMPLNVIIDRNFVVRYKAPGYNETSLRQNIESLL